MDPKARARELFERAYERQMAGDLTRAVELYTASIEAHPTAEAYTFRGWTYSFMGRLDDAIAECRKAIATDPDFGNPYNDIGAYLLQLGRPAEAVPWLERALEAPGRWEEARRALEKALELVPGYPPARQALTQLRARYN